jgi:hypothetical protein
VDESRSLLAQKTKSKSRLDPTIALESRRDKEINSQEKHKKKKKTNWSESVPPSPVRMSALRVTRQTKQQKERAQQQSFFSLSQRRDLVSVFILPCDQH